MLSVLAVSVVSAGVVMVKKDALPEVRAAVPVYLAQATWRNPETGARRPIQVIGFDIE